MTRFIFAKKHISSHPSGHRSELLAQYGANKNPTPSADAEPASPPSPVAGPSRDLTSVRGAAAEPLDVSTSYVADIEDSSSLQLADLSLSQIDPGVLAELPADLQAEIRSHYHRPPASSAAAEPAAKERKQRNINSSPAKTAKKGGGPRKRGRPKKTTVAARTTASGPTPAPDKNVACVKSTNNRGTDRVGEASEDSRLSGGDSSSCHTEGTEETSGQQGGRRTERPTFCGKSSIEEIRPLVKVFNGCSSSDLQYSQLNKYTPYTVPIN